MKTVQFVYISCKFKKASPLLYSLQFFLAMARQSILDFVGLSVYWYVLTAMHPLWMHRKEILYICCCTILHKSPLSTYYELDKVCKKTRYVVCRYVPVVEKSVDKGLFN